MRSVVRHAAGAAHRSADLVTRLRVQRLLAAATLDPDGLPPAAVLLVRSLPDPLPGRPLPQRAAVRAPPEWELALRTALAERLRAAARPVRGVVPADAGSVLFADQAEMLAVFARDAAAGTAGRRWWWAAVLRGLPGGDLARLSTLWTREARYVPAALEHLSSWEQAECVLASLPVDQVTRILAAVARAFNVSAMLAVPPSLPLRPPPIVNPHRSTHAERGRTASPRTTNGAVDEGSDAAPEPPLAPPWERVVPPALVPRTFGPERQALLGAGLVLHRAPLVARSPGFVAAFVRWRAAVAEVDAPSPPSRLEVPTRSIRGSADAAGGEGFQVAMPEGPHSTEQVAAHDEPWQWRLPSFPAEQTHSGLCGTFYLVNVVRALGFFRALDEHFRLPPVLGGWGWIELLARCLLRPSATADEPIWRLLATLDGREHGVPVGSGFGGPPVESLPEAWARLLADAGECPPEPSPPLGAEPSSDLRRFLDLVVPFVRLRLEATLRAAGADEPLETAMFRRVGLVQVTSSHVDVRMTLDQVTLPARLAGLDASPGWVPELGRVVTFHFQERIS
jgi:hypothetical protein